MAAVLVEKGNTTDLEANAAGVRLETVLLEVSPGMTEVVDMDQGTVLYLVPLMLTPETLVAESVISPVPQAINSHLDTADVVGIEHGCGWYEGAGDMAIETMVGVCMCEAVSGLIKDKVIVHELLLQVSNLPGVMGDCSMGSTVLDDLGP